MRCLGWRCGPGLSWFRACAGATVGELHDAAFRAGVWQVIEQRAKELKDQAKADLAALEVGDTVAGRYEGHTIAKATMTKGRAKLVVTDEHSFLNWVAGHHPTEIISQINPAFIKHIEGRAKEYGAPIDTLGEVIPGVELVDGEPYVTVRREKDAAAVVAQLLASGGLSLDEVKAVEPSRWAEDTEAGAIG